MARTTRSTKSKAAAGGKGSTTTTDTTATTTTSSSNASSKSRYTLPPETTNPPKLFILPSKATKDARIVSLLNPRHGKPTRYLACPESGLYEFTRIAAPKSAPRSWLIEGAAVDAGGKTSSDGNDDDDDGGDGNAGDDNDDDEFAAHVTKGADLFVATPIDPLFLVLPALAAASRPDKKRYFLSSDDHFDSIARESPHLGAVLRLGGGGGGGLRRLLEARLAAACETSEGPDAEPMFRFSEDRLLDELLAKAAATAGRPLPASLEDRFVTKALEVPMLGVKRGSPAQEQTEPEPGSGPGSGSVATPASETTPSAAESSESQASAQSATSNASGASTAATEETTTATPVTTITTTTTTTEPPASTTTAAAQTPSEEVTRLQRQRTAFQFLLSRYISAALAAALNALLAGREEAEGRNAFAALDAHLARVARLRQEAQAARSAGGDYSSRKRDGDGYGDEEAEERAEKKRRREEEEKRKKAGLSRGVRDLRKVNTAGMKKMSDFFKKK